MLIRISYRDLCFAVETTDGIVTFAAPCARWMIGKTWGECLLYWINRGAEIKILG